VRRTSGVTVTARLERLERYGARRLAVAWTVTDEASNPRDPRPKTVITKGWQHTRPLPDGPFGTAMF
jgi:hypothetical protein